MVKASVANWREQAKMIGEVSFDCDAALRLAKEIQDCAGDGSIGYRAAQAIHIIEKISRLPKPSARQISDAKMAFSSLSRMLEQIKLQ